MIANVKVNPFLDWHHQHTSFRRFILDHLLASPGALVIKDGILCRIRTIVPSRNIDGWCTFFDGRHCTVHPVAPFGCAFFDSHQEQGESNVISAKGLQIIARLWENQPRSLYCQVWNDLYRTGRRASAPEECRNRMRKHHGKSD
jgi:Fe-S-cluster containining protein